MNQTKIKLVECPRDAMQGIEGWIPTTTKIKYLNQLLKVGFDTLDFGSFVSPKAIPQMKDTEAVLAGLKLNATKTKLLAIVANQRGAEQVVKHEQISFLGYPFSLSETFQKRNTNVGIEASLSRLESIQNLVKKNEKSLLVYLSMGFGNPYGDPYHEDLAARWIEKISELEVSYFSLSDTIGVSEPGIISRLFGTLIPEFPHLEIGAHLHTAPHNWKEKIKAAYNSGCRKFDGAIAGYGGCPMAADELVGNMPTENMIDYFNRKGLKIQLNQKEFMKALDLSSSVFSP